MSNWLSVEIVSLETRRQRILEALSDHPKTLMSGVSERLIRWQTWRGGIVVCAATAILLFIVAILPAFVSCIGSIDSSEIEVIRASVATLAEISSGIAGILLAVVVFSVQLHAQRDDEGAFMSGYLVRKHYVPWIIGYSFGFAASNSLLLLFGQEEWIWWRAVTVIDFFGFVLLIFLTYKLFLDGVQDATKPTFDLGFPIFCRDLASSVAKASYLSEMRSRFSERLATTCIKQTYGLFRDAQLRGERSSATVDEVAFDHYLAGNKGTILDVDLVVLHGLEQLLKPIIARIGKVKCQLLLSPGDHIPITPAFAISREKSDDRRPLWNRAVSAASERTDDLTPNLRDLLSNEEFRDIQDLVNRLFKVTVQPGPDVKGLLEFFRRFDDKIKKLVVNSQAVELESLLQRYQTVVELTAGDHFQIRSLVGWSFLEEAKLVNPLESSFYELTRLGVVRQDPETIEVLVQSYQLFYSSGVRRNSPSICQWSLALLAYCYHLSLNEHSARGEKIKWSERFDRILHFVHIPFECRNQFRTLQNDDSANAIFLEERPLVDEAIAFNLEVVRFACDAGVKNDAILYLDRLVEYREHRHSSSLDFERAPSSEDVDTLHDYALILTFAWSLHRIENGKLGDAAREAHIESLKFIVKQFPGHNHVAAVWELYHRRDLAGVQVRLRMENLSRELVSRRVGKTRIGIGRPDWEFNGVLGLMLCLAKQNDESSSGFFDGPPEGEPWRVGTVEKLLHRLVNDVSLGVLEGERELAVNVVSELISRRVFVANVATLQAIASDPVNDDKWTAFQAEAINAWRKDRKAAEYIEVRAELTSPIAIPLKPRLRVSVPIDSLQSSGISSTSHYGRYVGEALASNEGIRLFYALEQPAIVKEGGSGRDAVCAQLAELQDFANNGRMAMSSRGYSPNAIVIPRNDRFLFALLRHPLWQHQPTTEGAIGRWEDLDVLLWPYSDPTTVTIVDVRQYFGRKASNGVLPSFKYVEPSDELRTAYLEDVNRSATPKDLPDHATLAAEVSAELESICHIADVGACWRIDIGASDAMYAMLESDRVYHRANCKRLDGHTPQLSLHPSLPGETDDRQPCEECRPDQWDIDAYIAV